MNDQELLTYAANAFVDESLHMSCNKYFRFVGQHEDLMPCFAEWNPLANDADAFQLMVKLGMMVDARYKNCISKRYNRVVYWDNPMEGKEIEFGDAEMDEYALARRAIVKAAAEIGKAMK